MRRARDKTGKLSECAARADQRGGLEHYVKLLLKNRGAATSDAWGDARLHGRREGATAQESRGQGRRGGERADLRCRAAVRAGNPTLNTWATGTRGANAPSYLTLTASSSRRLPIISWRGRPRLWLRFQDALMHPPTTHND